MVLACVATTRMSRSLPLGSIGTAGADTT